VGATEESRRHDLESREKMYNDGWKWKKATGLHTYVYDHPTHGRLCGDEAFYAWGLLHGYGGSPSQCRNVDCTCKDGLTIPVSLKANTLKTE
jgi:hypothetical protein